MKSRYGQSLWIGSDEIHAATLVPSMKGEALAAVLWKSVLSYPHDFGVT